eukprot:m.161857 g.161857  ORF g.161857 m.161857 type:complete len:414 (-) comp18058_c0_seq1:225-1466(-)
MCKEHRRLLIAVLLLYMRPTARGTVVINGTDVYVTSCSRNDPPEHINTTDHGGANCTVHIGAAKSLYDINCDITIEALGSFAGDFPTVVIDASADNRTMTWTMLGSGIRISNEGVLPVDVFLQNVNVHVKFGEVPVSVDLQEVAFETVVEFPQDNRAVQRAVVMRASTASLLFNGSYSLAIGDTSSMVPQTPFEFLHGQVFLGASPVGETSTRNTVTVKTVIGLQNDTATHWFMDSYTLSEVGRPKRPVAPGKWMQAQLTYNHFTSASGMYCENCTLHYNTGRNKNFSIGCGNNRDSFIGVNVTAHISVDMGANDDTVEWWTPNSTSPAWINMGAGNDDVMVVCPLPTTWVQIDDYTNSTNFNVLNIYANGFGVTGTDNVYTHIGPNASDFLKVVNYDNESDIVSIKNGIPPP